MIIDLTPDEVQTIAEALDHSAYDTRDLLDSGILDVVDNPEEAVFCRQLVQRLQKIAIVGEKILAVALSE